MDQAVAEEAFDMDDAEPRPSRERKAPERIEVDAAPVAKRFHARAKGRGNRIVKRNSHITVLVGDGRTD